MCQIVLAIENSTPRVAALPALACYSSPFEHLKKVIMARSAGLSSVKDSGAVEIVLDGEEERAVLGKLFQRALGLVVKIVIASQLGQKVVHPAVP